ncbi:hypothetical protein PENTCL1PPCAC_8268, partial [Pristionchus entomophagus]
IIGEGNREAASDNLINEGKNESIVHSSDDKKDYYDIIDVVKRRRSSGGVTKAPKYMESFDSDEDSESEVKKLKSDFEKKDADKMASSHKREAKSTTGDKDRKVTKLNGSELECPECDYHTRNVSTWLSHLRLKHSTTPALSGLALRCDCGNESLSEEHSRMCTIANVTILQKRDGPIRRLTDLKKPTVMCVLCEALPKTPRGYTRHLRIYHKSTLIVNGIYLVCDCGCEVRNEQDNVHADGCDKRQFTLHKL